MIFNLKSICCDADISTHGTQKIPYICTSCKDLITVRYDIRTPCCRVPPIVLKKEDAWQCAACDSTWDLEGILMFMDPTWSYKEGVDSAL